MRGRCLSTLFVCALLGGCEHEMGRGPGGPGGSGQDAGTGGGSCGTPEDQQDCDCPSAGMSRACWKGPVASRGVVTPATRWRVLSDGRVQRSVTNGTSWDVVAVDASLHVMAGGAPSSMVCWLVGPGGVVLRTTDRLHFERLTFPEAVDLIGVRATSDLAAAVTTHDGRTFATTDAGRTWRAEP